VAAETPTALATSTTEATAVALPTDTPMPTATAAGPPTLPQTGSSGPDNTLLLMAALLMVALAVVGSGALIRDKKRA
jgi:LPXTG-motif cell wall-anchored protein